MEDADNAAVRLHAVNEYMKKLLQHKELDARVRTRMLFKTYAPNSLGFFSHVYRDIY